MSIPLQPGDSVADKYVVDHVLAEGGMGIVFAATDTQLDRKVAIKVLSPDHLRSQEAGARFLQEARAAVRLTSDHVVKIFDLGTLPSGVPYMVMEMLRGADLAAVLDSEGPLAVTDAVGFVVQACEAVGEAHCLGIVHRDLKPANLFLSRQLDGTSRIKVLDFGISKLTDTANSGQVSLTRTSWMLGSPVYMSPEQLRSARDVDARSDIWALGTILFELLAGKPPFTGESVPELSAKILIDSAPNPNDGRDIPLPPGLDSVILRTLHKDAAGRYGSVAEFALALAPFAPKRCLANIERVARLQQVTGLSNSTSTIPPEAAPARSAPSSGPSQKRNSWGSAVSAVFRKYSQRRTLVTIAAAIVVGSLMGVALTTRTQSGGGVEAAAAATRTPATAPTGQAIPATPVPVPAAPAGEPSSASAAEDEPPAPSAARTIDTGTPDQLKSTHEARARKRSTRSSARSDVERGGDFGTKAPLREDFGERR